MALSHTVRWARLHGPELTRPLPCCKELGGFARGRNVSSQFTDPGSRPTPPNLCKRRKQAGYSAAGPPGLHAPTSPPLSAAMGEQLWAVPHQHSRSALSSSQSPTCTPVGRDTAWGSSHPVDWRGPHRPRSFGAAAPPGMHGACPSPVLVLQSRSCCAGDPAGMGARGGPGTPRKCNDIKQPDFPVYSGSVTAGRT